MVINSPRGTADLFGDDIRYRDFVINTARNLFGIFNYSEIITPVFEHTELFDRSIGENTEIVRKEMYTFTDKKGRSLTLRPEGTASVVRAIIEKKMYPVSQPLKLFYIENMFRYERPQKGRMREFWQLGVEAAGTDDPVIDAEVIWLLVLIFKEIGFKNLKLLINSVGCIECRNKFIIVFKEYLKPAIESLCTECRARYEKNPLRIFDCKVEDCRTIIAGSPKIYDYICNSCRKHLVDVLKLLKIINIEYTIKADLVRGFDYYTKTIFEIISDDLESVQNALGGGGRYDKLIEQFGGPAMPAVGFAVGIDRTIMLMKHLNIPFLRTNEKKAIFIVSMKREYKNYCLKLLKFLREAGFRTEISYDDKAVGSHIKWAEKNSFTHVVVIGEYEVTSNTISIKDLTDFKQYSINWIKESAKILELLGKKESCHD